MTPFRTEAVDETLLADGEVIRWKRVVEDWGPKLVHDAGGAVWSCKRRWILLRCAVHILLKPAFKIATVSCTNCAELFWYTTLALLVTWFTTTVKNIFIPTAITVRIKPTSVQSHTTLASMSQQTLVWERYLVPIGQVSALLYELLALNWLSKRIRKHLFRVLNPGLLSLLEPCSSYCLGRWLLAPLHTPVLSRSSSMNCLGGSVRETHQLCFCAWLRCDLLLYRLTEQRTSVAEHDCTASVWLSARSVHPVCCINECSKCAPRSPMCSTIPLSRVPKRYPYRRFSFAISSMSQSCTLVVRKDTAVRHSGLIRLARYNIFATYVWKHAASDDDAFSTLFLTSKKVSAAGAALSAATPHSDRMSRTQFFIVMRAQWSQIFCLCSQGLRWENTL